MKTTIVEPEEPEDRPKGPHTGRADQELLGEAVVGESLRLDAEDTRGGGVLVAPFAFAVFALAFAAGAVVRWGCHDQELAAAAAVAVAGLGSLYYAHVGEWDE